MSEELKAALVERKNAAKAALFRELLVWAEAKRDALAAINIDWAAAFPDLVKFISDVGAAIAAKKFDWATIQVLIADAIAISQHIKAV